MVANASSALRRRTHVRRVVLDGARLVARRVRFEPAVPLAMAALVAATCFLYAALPGLYDTLSDRGLRHVATQAAPLARVVSVLESGRVPAGAGTAPLGTVELRETRSQQILPVELRRLVAGRTVVVRSPQYAALDDPATTAATVSGLARYLRLDLWSNVSPRIRVVAGRLPRPSPAHQRVQVSQPVFSSTGPASQVSWTSLVPRVEVALSSETARQLHLRVGDHLVFAPEAADPAVQQVPLREAQPLSIEVVGLFDVRRPRDDYWAGDTSLRLPQIRVTPGGDLTQVFGDALVAPAQYPTLLAATRLMPLGYEFRNRIAPERLRANELGRLRAAVAGIEARYAGAGPLETRVATGLRPVLERFEAARSQATTLLAVAAIGVLACALANILLLGTLSYDRHRGEIAVSRVRGGTPRQVLALQTGEALVTVVPAGFLGWVAAVIATGGDGAARAAWLAGLLTVATVCLLVAASAGPARRPLGPDGREDVVLGRRSPRRLALEALVAAAAILGAYLLRRRGLDAPGAGGGSGFDPFLAGVPVLLGLALGIVALRVYPLPLAAAARLARRARGLALHLGLSRAARQAGSSAAPLYVLVLALAIASFSAIMLQTLESGQGRVSWRAVGADLRVDAPADGSLPPALVRRLGAAGTLARAYVQDTQVGEGNVRTLLIGLDLGAYERVVAGTPAATRFAALRTPPPIPGVVPALVSPGWPTTGSFQVALPSQAVGFLAVGERASLPGIPGGTAFAIVPLDKLEAVVGALPPTRLYLRGESAADVQGAVDELAPRATVVSRGAIVRSLRASPLVDGVIRGFRAAIVIAALYAAVAVVLMTLLAERTRSRDLALVRTMGGSRRGALALAAVELAPLVAVALTLGIGLGIAVPYLIAPGLDLRSFTGEAHNPVALAWPELAAFAAGLLVLVAASVVLTGRRTRRADLDRVLRMGER